MEGRVVFVTGAASGIGRAIARRLTAGDATVVVSDIDEVGAKAVAEELSSGGASASHVLCDVSDRAAVEAACAQSLQRHGHVDALVNNAGFDIPGWFLESDPTNWGRLLAVNLVGVLNCAHVFGPHIAERCRETGYGRIVSVASDAGRVGGMGEAVYSAAKGGIIAFSRALARELARDRVTVNAVCPGPADTPMTDAIVETELGRKVIERTIATTPLKRLAAPEEVAEAVAYFLADAAGFTTGQIFSVSGGLTMSG